jgi:hypothetical protein
MTWLVARLRSRVGWSLTSCVALGYASFRETPYGTPQ